MTVHAAPQAEGFYRRLGFHEVAPEQVKNQVRYVPMERAMSAEEIRLQKKAKRRGKFLMLAILALVVLLGIGVGTTAYRVFTMVQDGIMDGGGMKNPFLSDGGQTDQTEKEMKKETGEGKVDRVGTHVGYESCLVELLRDAHGVLRRESELAACLLLEC